MLGDIAQPQRRTNSLKGFLAELGTVRLAILSWKYPLA